MFISSKKRRWSSERAYKTDMVERKNCKAYDNLQNSFGDEFEPHFTNYNFSPMILQIEDLGEVSNMDTFPKYDSILKEDITLTKGGSK